MLIDNTAILYEKWQILALNFFLSFWKVEGENGYFFFFPKELFSVTTIIPITPLWTVTFLIKTRYFLMSWERNHTWLSFSQAPDVWAMDHIHERFTLLFILSYNYPYFWNYFLNSRTFTFAENHRSWTLRMLLWQLFISDVYFWKTKQNIFSTRIIFFVSTFHKIFNHLSKKCASISISSRNVH